MGSAELAAPLAGRLAEAAGGLVAGARLPARARAPLPGREPRRPSPPTAGSPAGTSRPRSWSAASARGADWPSASRWRCATPACPEEEDACRASISCRPSATWPGRPRTSALAADSDPWLSRIALIQLAACYIHGADPAQALVSPARADLSGLPPLLIQAAEPEALFASARRLADQAGRGRRRGHVQPGRRQRPFVRAVRFPAGDRPRAGRVRRVRAGGARRLTRRAGDDGQRGQCDRRQGDSQPRGAEVAERLCAESDRDHRHLRPTYASTKKELSWPRVGPGDAVGGGEAAHEDGANRQAADHGAARKIGIEAAEARPRSGRAPRGIP